jgi:hypothetical protein
MRWACAEICATLLTPVSTHLELVKFGLLAPLQEDSRTFTMLRRLTWASFLTQVFTDCDFTLMEMNPFTLDASGAPFPLDMRWACPDNSVAEDPTLRRLYSSISADQLPL